LSPIRRRGQRDDGGEHHHGDEGRQQVLGLVRADDVHARSLELEVDHLAHHEDADAHPDDGDQQHELAARIGEQRPCRPAS
jgi:hypothetical protein